MSDIVENEALRAKLAEDEANINLKADFIEKTINDSAALDQRVKELERALDEVCNVRVCKHSDSIWDAADRCRKIARTALKGDKQ